MGYSHRGFRGYLSGFGAIRATGPIYATQFRATADGTLSEYAFTWDVDPNTGLRRIGADNFNAGVAGNSVINVQQFQASFGEGIQNQGGFAATSFLTPAAITGTVNDYTPTAWNGARGWIRQDCSAAVTLTGLGATGTGHVAGLWNISAFTITLKNENTGSIAANRFLTSGAGDYVLAAGEGVLLIYDGTSARWRTLGTA